MTEFSHTSPTMYVHLYICEPLKDTGSDVELRTESLKVMSYTSAYKNCNSIIIHTAHTQQENTSLVAALGSREVKGQYRLHV